MLYFFKVERRWRMKKILFIGILFISLIIGRGIMLVNDTPQEQIKLNENVELAIYLNDEEIDFFPEKNNQEGYVFDKAVCYINGQESDKVTVTWDRKLWAPVIQGLSEYKTHCDLYFREPTFSDFLIACNDDKNAAECFLENASLLPEELAYDETTDNNLRYIGANPNNYVSFNGELWRIIGIMNNIDDGTGTKETRLKIIRDESIGKYSFDNTGEYGNNDWSSGALQKVLNEGAYWNRGSGKCPFGNNGAVTSCDFSAIGLTAEAKALFSPVLWNLGRSSTYEDVLASMFYERERGTDVYEGHSTEWIGNVGFMYPSDYGYATSGGSTTNRETCLQTSLYNWKNFEDCYSNDWLNRKISTWTLTPLNSTIVFHANVNFVNGSHAYSTYVDILPVVYLKTNIRIVAGEGKKENPYILSLP